MENSKLQTFINSYPWPTDGGVYQLHPLSLQANHPGKLDTLTHWGIEYRLVNDVAGLVTTGDLDNLWCALAIAFPETGLWPVVTCGKDGDLDNPWGGGLDMLDAPQEVNGSAEQYFLTGAQNKGIDLPALTPPIASAAELLFAPAEVPGGHGLLVVPCTRPADVPAVVGWRGGSGYHLDGATMSLALRSWENRFGAVVMYLDYEDLILQVAGDSDDADIWESIICEHEVLCPCVLRDGFEGDREAFLTEYLQSGCWGLWWWQ